MAVISITVPDAQLSRVVNAMCETYGRDPADPVAKGEFARRALIRFVRGVVVGYEEREAARLALAALVPAADVPIT